MKKVYQVWVLAEEFETKKEAVEYVELNYEPDEITKIESREVK